MKDLSRRNIIKFMGLAKMRFIQFKSNKFEFRTFPIVVGTVLLFLLWI